MSTESSPVLPDCAIAIVGMSCRLPGATGLQEFWANLLAGRESIRSSTEDELRRAGVPDSQLGDPNFVTAGGRLDGFEWFDAQFFGMTPRKAEVTSPQQRLLFETAQLALDDAGYYAEAFDGRIGIFCAVESSDYLFRNLSGNPELLEEIGFKSVQFANDPAFSATQVAYNLILEHMAVNVTTACSSSLVAIHMACRSLLSYEADLMLAGGASCSVAQHLGYMFQDGGIGSRDGHCRAFGADATGTVSANGAGMIALKRLEDAVRDRDSIYAVILGSAINNDGSDKVSYSAPGLKGQATAIRDALSVAGIGADAVGYVEAHGTGTSLGDPIEVAALTAAFRELTTAKQFCGLGSLKSNIGHLGCAAGVGGMIKVALALHNRKLPPTLHADIPNSALNLEASPFYLNTRLRDWPTQERVAGLSSFGMGGTNAHAIVRSWPVAANTPRARSSYILPLSAANATSLHMNVGALRAFLEENPDANLADVAYTLQVGRKPRNHRVAMTARDTTDAIRLLREFDAERVPVTSGRVVMMFPGQGNQYPAMGKALLADEPAFREHFEQCCEYLRREHALDLHRILFDGENEEERKATLRQTRHAQVALFVIEYSLARTLERYGVTPTAMIGHSVGEYVAATLAGVFSLYAALDVLIVRGRLMQALPAGAMAAVRLSEDDVRKRLPANLDIAVVNHRNQTVVAGLDSVVKEFIRLLAEDGISARTLDVSHAFHSAMMQPCLDEFTRCLEAIELKSPRIPFVSNVTGEWITSEQAMDPKYWALHMRSCVRFRDGLRLLASDADSLFLEVGPGRSIRQAFKEEDYLKGLNIQSCMSSALAASAEIEALSETIAACWQNGSSICWNVWSSGKGRRLHLPGYRFDRHRHWVDASPAPVVTSDTRQSDAPRPLSESTGNPVHFHIPVWHPERLTLSSSPVAAKTWVIIGGEVGDIAGMRARLELAGQQIIEVLDGSGFARVSPDRFRIPFGDPLAYAKLLDSIAADAPQYFIYCSGRRDADDVSATDDVGRNFHDLMNLHRAIRTSRHSSATLICLGSGVGPCTAPEAAAPAGYMSAIVCRCLQHAYPEVRTVYFDVARNAAASPDDETPGREWADHIINEWKHGLPASAVSFRRSVRYVRKFMALPRSVPQARARAIRKCGTYVVTGGWGGIGFEVVRHLLKEHEARVVILSRSAPVHPADLPVQREQIALQTTTAEQLRLLVESGAQLMSIPVDVADTVALSSALELARERYGKIDGVFHAAGVESGGMLENRADLDCTLRPKVLGSVNLIEWFRHHDPDFVLLFSSRNALEGDSSRADHSAANAYMDGLAWRFSAEGLPITSVNWCAWRDVGMFHHLRAPTPTDPMAAAVRDALSTGEGIALIEELVQAVHPQIVISRSEVFGMEDVHVPLSSREPSAQERSGERVENAVGSADIDIATSIQEKWKGVLGVSRVGVHDNFFELGGDSLSAVHIISQLRNEYGVPLSLGDFVEKPTIAALEEHILRRKIEEQDPELLQQILQEIGLGTEEAAPARAVSEDDPQY